MNLFAILFLTFFAFSTFANDGGVYFLPVEQIKKTNSNPENASVKLEISFQGKKAEILRNSLPPVRSVDKETTKHANTLVLLDEKSDSAVEIYCTDREYDKETYKLVQLGTTKCTIQLVKKDPEMGYEQFGDMEELTAPMCKR